MYVWGRDAPIAHGQANAVVPFVVVVHVRLEGAVFSSSVAEAPYSL